MLWLIYFYRNLTRNPLRTHLTCAAVALPIVIYVLSMAVVDGVNRFLDNSAKQLRLAITHKASIVNPLPQGYRARIESLDPNPDPDPCRRRLIVCGMNWIGGKIERDPRPLSTLGADADTFAATFPDYQLTDEETGLWIRDRQAIIVGCATARQFNWKVGDRITINPSVPPYTPMEFHVVSTAENAKDPITLWCRRDYVQEEIKKAGYLPGNVSFFFVKCQNKADLDRFCVEIDRLFANSPDETKTQDEKAFMNEFITQQFDLPRNLTILALVTVFVAVMAAANTMSMNFRDRMNEMATLKAMGFSAGFVSGFVQLESMCLCAAGGLIGAFGPYVVFNWTPLKDFTVPLIMHLDVRLAVCGQALLIAMAIGILAAIWPSWLAWRLKVVSALRNLE
jgi:putative ABC transport system permease protein